jgi:hypothetical protein
VPALPTPGVTDDGRRAVRENVPHQRVQRLTRVRAQGVHEGERVAVHVEEVDFLRQADRVAVLGDRDRDVGNGRDEPSTTETKCRGRALGVSDRAVVTAVRFSIRRHLTDAAPCILLELPRKVPLKYGRRLRAALRSSSISTKLTGAVTVDAKFD